MTESAGGNSLRLRDYLDHIVEAAARIRRFTDDMTELAFLENELVQDGVIRNIEVIGEAARNVQRRFPQFAAKHAEVPWEDIYWMRNRLSHGYFAVDLELVWKTVERDIPELEAQILRLREATNE
ncbi:MAG: DUF86 domain-containing protein [Gammaproteobacteria bacterium]|nr:DUF86 domain-containing protein [Gammaproteobacteria bacterium]MBU1414586.1 DUF86 domain-containing protein [Gammaproteobacteria bacterium]